MKLIKALTAFAGYDYSAASGQVIACSEEFADDMIRAGYAVEVSAEQPEAEKPTKTAKKRTTKK